MTDKTKSPSRMAGYNETMRQLVARDGLVCFLCGHKHATVHTIQADLRVVADAGGSFELDNLVVTCKPCAKRRNGKPIGAYWRERMSAAAAEMAHIEMMAANKGVIQALSATIHYAPRITEDTPDAVGVTGHVGPVLTRPSRLYHWSNMKIEDLDKPDLNTGKPKDRQHKDIFVDNWNHQDEYLVWDATFENKNASLGRWRPLDDCVAEGVVPEGWESDESLAIWPDVEP